MQKVIATGRGVYEPKIQVEQCIRLRVSYLRDRLHHVPADSVEFKMSFATNRGKWVNDRVSLVKVPCFNNRYRWLFVCPGCGQWAAVLYIPPGSVWFKCRHCHDLSYALRQISQHSYYRFLRDFWARDKFFKKLEDQQLWSYLGAINYRSPDEKRRNDP